MRKPYIILNSAVSLDGRIAGINKRIRFSNQLDKERVHKLRTGVDAVMVGINTILVDDPHLTVKYASGKNPVRIVVDSSARIPINARVLNDRARTIIAVSGKAEKNKIKILREYAEIVVSGDENNKVNLKQLLENLQERGIKKILLEGGGTLNRSMLEAGLVDEIFVTIAPVLVGEGVNLVVGNLNKKINLKFGNLFVLEDRIVLHYFPDYS